MKHLDLLYVFDDNYAPYAGISMTSLLHNLAEDTSVTIYCGGMNISRENREKLEATAAEQRLVWLDVSEAVNIINTYETGAWNGSKATWLKVFLPWLLPDSVDHVLYIDSDTIVAGDASQILDEKTDDAPISMVYESIAHQYGPNLGLDRYFNAGVLWISVKTWKQPGFKDNFLNTLKQRGGRYKANEQCLLNDYFREKIHGLPMKYNTQGFHYLYNEVQYRSCFDTANYYTDAEIKEAKESPIIVHFFRILGDYPWEEGNYHPCGELYLKYKKMSLWKDFEDKKKKRSFVFIVERILFRMLPRDQFIKIFKAITVR